MGKRALMITFAVCVVLTLIGIFLLDKQIALAVHRSGIENAAIVVRLREFFDIFTGRGLVGAYVGLGQFLLGAILFALGFIGWMLRRSSHVARGIMFAGMVQLATIEAAWLVKDLFGRLRPYELIGRDDWSHVWFMGGNSFPSGHNAFFWGLCLPLAFAFPRWWMAILVVPVFIAFARIDENYHFLSDVTASIALAALVTLIAAMLFGRWLRPAGKRQA